MTPNPSLLIAITSDDLAAMDRKALRQLARDAIGTVDRETMNKATALRELILERAQQVQAEALAEVAEPEIVAEPAAQVADSDLVCVDCGSVEFSIDDGACLACGSTNSRPAGEVVEAAPEPQAEEPAPEPAPERKARGSKWTGIVEQLWALREDEQATEVEIPVETLVEMGLPPYACKRAVNWRATEPPGKAARSLGLVTTFHQKEGKPHHLTIRAAGDDSSAE